ncbi:MAG TPA: 2Fe-2S iron-sulfur cluster-binding protein [Methylomusa anaerophila]|uniref:NADP-reducing hydrogenase subunit HndC n=1 Tax=Methylomusa anaerophila TaxID=1930071 RepID=A0A348ALV3_9FIRM|nr:2Fe-2S iron-sulfur cluster-binding protein [Methylomusa anaerophila]BBB92051.1 NADP-reducing hydrogenase subunit HndC [Methylomusa anaerophila]HML87937.1 2Fe-2S iron-sulfur cluster-binding protein [Methylomusa anaerophila]
MNITIDGKICQAEYGEFILAIAKRNDIHIPTLCHNDALPGQASCRLCIVDIVENGRNKVVTACVYPVTKEIEVITNSPKILNMRKTILMLLAARVPANEHLNKLIAEYSVSPVQRFASDPGEQCILCGLCVKACETVGLAAISTVSRGITKKVSTPYDEPSLSCIGCGACAQVCPTGAIKIVAAGKSRTIWNKNFELIKCEECGKYFATREQLEYINTKLGLADEDTLRLCEDCKTALVCEKFKNLYAANS